MRVLVTGATGNLGRKAVNALASRDDVAVVRIDQRGTDGDASLVRADLASYDADWAAQFRDVDVVVHLAGEQSPVASWDAVLRSNIDVTVNVLRAADQAAVRRFVFASSNWVLAGYRFTPHRLMPTTPPRPVNPYGVSKLLLERIGLDTAARTDMAFLALRIGYCQPGDNVPGPHMAYGRWGQQMWLSNEDWAQAVERSCTATFEGSAVLNVMSDNASMRWDLADSARVIGYRPRRRHTPRLTPARHIEDAVARLREAARPPMSPTPLLGSRW